MAQDQGYDYSFVDGQPSNDYICLICTLVAREAHQVKCCGKIFCKGCLEQMKTLSDRYDCPNCRCGLTENHFFDIRANRQINQLLVHCDHRKEGCLWKGCLEEAELHLLLCPERIVACTNKCGKRMKAHQLTEHLETACRYRPVTCPYCEIRGKHYHISGEHLKKCPEVEVSCPNQDCAYEAKRKHMDSHRSTCPKESINCDYVDVGCDFTGLREKMQQHNSQGMQVHLQLATEVARVMLEKQTGACNEVCFQVNNFSSLDTSSPWFSTAFYTSPGGYKMRIAVDVSSYGATAQLHTVVPDVWVCVSVFLHILQGRHDSSVQWPMKGKFEAKILNQERDKDHLTKDVTSSTASSKISDLKVCSGRVGEIIGSAVFFFLPSDGSYVKNDTMYLRVKTIKIKSTTKPWLVATR